jgi:hypothetical protein
VLRNPKPQTSCCDKTRGCFLLWTLLALAIIGLLLGVAIGLAYGTSRDRHFRRGPSNNIPWALPGFVFTGDPQLDALMQLKAAVDPTGTLDGLWERDSGRHYGFCR